MKKKLVVLEGISGVGKTTIAKALSDHFAWNYIPEIIDHNKSKKFTEEYFTIVEEIKIGMFTNSALINNVMDRSPISIMAHNYVRKMMDIKNLYDDLLGWFKREIDPIKKKHFVYLRTSDYDNCIKRKWGVNLENFPKEYEKIPGMKIWAQKESLIAFQEYYDNFFSQNQFNVLTLSADEKKLS